MLIYPVHDLIAIRILILRKNGILWVKVFDYQDPTMQIPTTLCMCPCASVVSCVRPSKSRTITEYIQVATEDSMKTRRLLGKKILQEELQTLNIV